MKEGEEWRKGRSEGEGGVKEGKSEGRERSERREK